MEMGHGDENVIADANFPAACNSLGLVRYDEKNTIEELKAILQFLPLGRFHPGSFSLMAVDQGDTYELVIWPEFLS